MNLIAKAWIPFFISLGIYICSLNLYEVNIVRVEALVSFIAALGIITLLMYLITFNEKINNLAQVPITFPRVTALVVMFCSLLEYIAFGIPLLGNVLYVDFGFPFIHHIVVSSWLLIFISRIEKIRFLRVTFFLVSFINPLLMLNRDVFLLTIFCFMVILIDEGRLRYRGILIGIFILLIIFGILGQIRSPFALASISLPFATDLSNVPSFVMWPLIYTTSSAFNMFNNFDTLGMELFSDSINVFPEAYGWVVLVGSYFGGTIFYFFASCLLLILHRLTMVHYHFYPLYIYFIYQSYMSIFSTKLFTSNALFISIVFIILFIVSNAILNRNKALS